MWLWYAVIALFILVAFTWMQILRLARAHMDLIAQHNKLCAITDSVAADLSRRMEDLRQQIKDLDERTKPYSTDFDY